MRNLPLFLLAATVVVVFASANVCLAQLVNYERRAKRQQIKAFAATGSVPAWVMNAPKVSSPDEKRYDVNNDGKLQTFEIKTFLRDTLDIVDQKGGVTINSDILKEYDKNHDGFISREEAKVVRQQVR